MTGVLLKKPDFSGGFASPSPPAPLVKEGSFEHYRPTTAVLERETRYNGTNRAAYAWLLHELSQVNQHQIM